MMGMMVIHGAQAGGFSPIAVYGVTVNGIIAKTELEASPMAHLPGQLHLQPRHRRGALHRPRRQQAAAPPRPAGSWNRRPSRGWPSASAPAQPVSPSRAPAPTFPRRRRGQGNLRLRLCRSTSRRASGARATVPQLVTIAGLIALAVISLGFKVDVGFVSITIAIVLALVSPAAQKGAINKISWSTVLLICGMLTFVGVLEEAGTIKFVSDGVAHLGMPLLAALLICYIGAVVSAFASSTAILAALIPLAVPFLSTGEIGAVGVIAALAVAATIVDVSPFSTNGALVLANAPEDVDKDKFYKQILAYSGIVVAAGPAIAWLVMVVPGWM